VFKKLLLVLVVLTNCMNHATSFLKLVLLTAGLLAVVGLANAQGWQWAKGEGDIGNDVANAVTTDDNGNSYVTGNIAGKANFSGTVYQGNGIYEVFVAKYGPTGDLLWVKLAGGRGNDQGNAITFSNGFVYVCGSFEDTATFGSTALISKGEGDVFLAKYDSDGNLVWAKSAGGVNNDYATAIDIGSGGQILLAGSYESAIKVDTFTLSTTNVYYESFYARYTTNGQVLWAKTMRGNNANLIAGLAFDHTNAVYLTGYFGGTFGMGSTTVTSVSSSYDIFLAKVNEADGALIWLKRAGSTYEDGAHSVCCDNEGNPSITGYFAGTASFDSNSVTYSDYNDVFVARYDAAGNNQWVRAGKGNKLDVGFAIDCDGGGNVYATGMFQNLCNFDGNILTTPDILDRDIFLVSYDKYGNLRWITRAGGEDTDCGLGLSVQSSGAIALCGYYLHTCYFGDIAIEYADASDLFIARYDAPQVGIAGIANDLQAALYPNPCTQNCVLQLAEPNTALTYSIFNQLGQLVSSGPLSSSGHLPVSALQAGIYLVQVATPRGTKALRLVKQ
jgi:hypothetical protein